MTSSLKASVVIPCFNVLGVLEEQLEALSAQDFEGPFEVVLADNGSDDGLLEQVWAWSARFPYVLRWVDASSTRGVSHARNIGVEAAGAELVAICDADDLVSSGWLSALIEALACSSVAGGVNEIHRLNSELAVAWRGGPAMNRLPDKFSFLPYAVGCNIGVRRSVALRYGGWRTTYVAGGDDVDFSWRLQLAGERLQFAPAALVHYRYRPDLRGAARQLRLYARSEAQLLKEYSGAGARRRQPSQIRRDVSWIVRNIGSVVSGPASRGHWWCRVSALVGRLEGARAFRTWV